MSVSSSPSPSPSPSSSPVPLPPLSVAINKEGHLEVRGFLKVGDTYHYVDRPVTSGKIEGIDLGRNFNKKPITDPNQWQRIEQTILDDVIKIGSSLYDRSVEAIHSKSKTDKSSGKTETFITHDPVGNNRFQNAAKKVSEFFSQLWTKIKGSKEEQTTDFGAALSHSPTDADNRGSGPEFDAAFYDEDPMIIDNDYAANAAVSDGSPGQEEDAVHVRHLHRDIEEDGVAEPDEVRFQVELDQDPDEVMSFHVGHAPDEVMFDVDLGDTDVAAASPSGSPMVDKNEVLLPHFPSKESITDYLQRYFEAEHPMQYKYMESKEIIATVAQAFDGRRQTNQDVDGVVKEILKNLKASGNITNLTTQSLNTLSEMLAKALKDCAEDKPIKTTASSGRPMADKSWVELPQFRSEVDITNYLQGYFAAGEPTQYLKDTGIIATMAKTFAFTKQTSQEINGRVETMLENFEDPNLNGISNLLAQALKDCANTPQFPGKADTIAYLQEHFNTTLVAMNQYSMSGGLFESIADKFKGTQQSDQAIDSGVKTIVEDLSSNGKITNLEGGPLSQTALNALSENLARLLKECAKSIGNKGE